LRPLPYLIFLSRWLQLPLYLGLIVAQASTSGTFWVELIHLSRRRSAARTAIQRSSHAVTPVGQQISR
jgi:uncharacterized membrane protein YqhA